MVVIAAIVWLENAVFVFYDAVYVHTYVYIIVLFLFTQINKLMFMSFIQPLLFKAS